MVFLALQPITACSADKDVTVTYAITDMSVAGPELHVIAENHSANETVVWTKLQFLDVDAYARCTKEPPRRTHDLPTPNWAARREEPNSEQAGILPGLGVLHRVYALSNVNVADADCRMLLRVMTESHYQEIPVRIEIPRRAAPLNTSDPPAVNLQAQVERDIIGGSLLVRVVATNLSSQEFNIGIESRRLTCEEPVKANWNLLQDVPQGLAVGPGRLGPHNSIGFVNVVNVSVDSAARCTAEFVVVYEAYPTAYLSIGIVRTKLEAEGELTWSIDNMDRRKK